MIDCFIKNDEYKIIILLLLYFCNIKIIDMTRGVEWFVWESDDKLLKEFLFSWVKIHEKQKGFKFEEFMW
jgi:hypothetical protein